MPIIPNPEKFGFYQIGTEKTYSKIHALELQKKLNKFPHWNFNDEIFSKFDWNKEPNINLWDLYKLRAKQIRESYDYCVLFYSGGSDSHNLLSAWIESDCKIDEIATFHYYSGSKNKHSFMNAEVTRVAIPYVEELAKIHKFKYRLIDISTDIIKVVQDYNADYKYLITSHVSPNNHAKVMWRETINDYRDLISKGKSICFVWGAEKPFIGFDGRFYTQFIDTFDNCTGPYAQINFDKGYYDELFYQTPDMPEIVCKQSHIIKQFCQQVHDTKFYQTLPTKFGYNPTLKQFVSVNTVKQLLYPNWNPLTFCDGKTRSVVWSDRDRWFIEGNLIESKKYKNLTQAMFENIDPYWLNDVNDISAGLKAHVSTRYYLTHC